MITDMITDMFTDMITDMFTDSFTDGIASYLAARRLLRHWIKILVSVDGELQVEVSSADFQFLQPGLFQKRIDLWDATPPALD